MTPATSGGLKTAVLDVSGVQYASEKAVVETVLSHRPGVHRVEGTRSRKPPP